MQRFLPLDPLSLRAGTGPCQYLVPGSTSMERGKARRLHVWPRTLSQLVPPVHPRTGSGYFHKGWCPHGQRSQRFSG